MTSSGYLIPTISDFDKEAKYLIKTNPDPDAENWYSQEYNSLTCYLQSTDPDEADRADCYVILETNSRDEIAQILKVNCNYADISEGYEKLEAYESCDSPIVDCNRQWVGSEWDKQTRAEGRYLMGIPMNLEDLVPTNKDAAQILMRVARFHFEDNDPSYIRIKSHCDSFK